jgi:hypothetical protein
MTRAVQRNTHRVIELAVTATSLADISQMPPITATKNLDEPVFSSIIAHDNVALVVCKTARARELPVACAKAAEGAQEARPKQFLRSDSSDASYNTSSRCHGSALRGNWGDGQEGVCGVLLPHLKPLHQHHAVGVSDVETTEQLGQILSAAVVIKYVDPVDAAGNEEGAVCGVCGADATHLQKVMEREGLRGS